MQLTEWLDAHASDLLSAPAHEAARFIGDDLRAMECERELVARGMGKTEARRLVRAWRDANKRPREAGGQRIQLPEDWATVPDGWVVFDCGIGRVVMTEDGPQVSRVTTAPAYVSSRNIDAASGDESWVVSYLEGTVWRRIEAARDVFQAARSIVALSARGLPVSSVTASAMVEWLELFAAANDVPRAWTTRQFGWVRKQFVIGDPGCPIQPTATDPEGVGLLTRACRPAGTLDGWMGALSVASRHPLALVALGASLASPCLAITNTPGFVVSFDGRNSAGKTTVQRFAASVWGCGDELAPTPYIRTWDWTHNARESWCHALQHLPCIVDDTRRHTGHADRLVEAVYQMAHGQGRARMTDGKSAQETRRWRLVAISSGEDPLTQMSTAGGLRARTLQFWGSPFGGDCLADVQTINDVARTHYGHAGRAWVAALNPERAEVMRQRIDTLAAQWSVPGEVGSRLGRYAAAIGAALWCAQDWLGWWDWEGEDLAEFVRPALVEAMTSAAADADPAERAWVELEALLVAAGSELRVRGETVGRLDGECWQVLPGWLRSWAESSGYRHASLLSAWAESGRLVRREPDRATSKVQWEMHRPRVYLLKRDP